MFLYHQNLEENSNKTNTKKIAINRDEQPAANPSSFSESSTETELRIENTAPAPDTRHQSGS